MNLVSEIEGLKAVVGVYVNRVWEMFSNVG